MEGEQPQLGDLLTIDTNYLLFGMILQVCFGSCFLVFAKAVCTHLQKNSLVALQETHVLS